MNITNLLHGQHKSCRGGPLDPRAKYITEILHQESPQERDKAISTTLWPHSGFASACPSKSPYNSQDSQQTGSHWRKIDIPKMASCIMLYMINFARQFRWMESMHLMKRTWLDCWTRKSRAGVRTTNLANGQTQSATTINTPIVPRRAQARPCPKLKREAMSSCGDIRKRQRYIHTLRP